ncbi:D-glycero-alpha-D-manno-heptose-1,7-bisphosphate 7-phosphatase [Dyadobacter psychrophilus]|uniref:D,D-heptose 1,7-bisphosphate phosphatase n=1 Tax=Dyadobacter psychrophilus TaxID=651661 RepID=A0A1T5EAB8_9BACT|nr:HAD family hydrolase [Dyadobacter psychrophilus]SKB80796.1 D,D-heptose 1,7-bisphosphate phosphatase [Dyadobacter psychrophilus]
MPHPEHMPAKAVFLDKDGTLIKDVPYNADPEKVLFETGVFQGLASLQAMGYQLVIISNQPGIALGLFSQKQLDDLITYFYQIFEQNGLTLSGFYYCPHRPGENPDLCTCRKPQAGLILQAAAALEIDLQQSWMIGDILNDVEAGNRAGCQTVLINNGNETEWLAGPFRTPDCLAKDFTEAVNFIYSKITTSYVQA